MEFCFMIEDSGNLINIGTMGPHDKRNNILCLGVDVAAVEVLELTVLVEVLKDVDEHPAVVQTPTREEIERYAWTDVAIDAVA